MIAKPSSRALRRKAAGTRPVAAGNSAAVARIVAAARRHFFAHGFRNVTMDDLAAELGMSKKTLYASFRSKEALLEAVLKDKFKTVEADLESLAADSGGDALENLKRLLACLQHHTAEIQPPFVRDIRRSAPQLFGVIERRRRELIRRYFGRFFADARERGLVRRDIRIEVIIEILLGATEAVVHPQKLAELRLSPNEAYMDVINVILKGIVTDAGRAEL
ncbi:MAG TPA: TetR/AcrR family transcriptional regulator [Candidatus Binatia bacterium]|jgi:AcrR family transcriptional regulator